MANLPTYVVIQVHNSCSDESLQVVVEELRRNWETGGGGLQIYLQKPSPGFPDTVLHVSASNKHIIRIAEQIEVKKMDKEGFVRELTADRIDEFPESGRVGPLSLSDLQRCILHAIHRVHFGVDIIKLPGHGSSVMKRAPVVSSYEEKHLLTLIPTHDHETIESLYKNWKRTYFSSPVDQIRDYFGEGVSLYFSFSSLYTRFLIIIALLGITEFLSEKYLGMDHVYSSVGFTILNIFGLTLYLEVWKRTSNEHSYFWGTTGKLRNKIPRPEYRGDLRMSPISGKEEMYYSPRKTMKKVLMVSAPLTLLCLSIALMLMFASFYVEAELIAILTDPETGEIYPDIFSSVLSNIPSITYSLLIILFNSIYLKIARKLTIWENHRTQEQHDTHVTAKLVVFEFVNTFIALFYTGFYLQDLKSLKSQLFTTLMVQQAVNQVQEVLIPFFLHKSSSVRLMSKVSAKLGIKQKIIDRNVKNVEELSSEDPRIQPVLQDIGADHLDSLHDDFMELWLQFGHMFLFSAVYPLAAVLALSNNITELWADRYKMCRLTRKPRPVSVRDIGAWYTAFKLIGMLSVLTNCCLLSLDLKDRTEVSWFSSDLSWFLFWVLVEHILLCIFLGLDTLISDVPRHVKMEQDRTEHHFKQLSIKQKQE